MPDASKRNGSSARNAQTINIVEKTVTSAAGVGLLTLVIRIHAHNVCALTMLMENVFRETIS